MKYNFVACSTDEGSNFVRLFKPKYIPIQNLDELSDEEDITEYREDTLEEIENEKEYNEQGHLDTIKSVKVESLEFEKELGEVIKHFDEKKYDNKIDISNRTVQSNIVQIYFDESQEYDFEFGARGEPFYELSLEIGSDEIPRISCACHKNNIAVRMAIQKSPQLSKLLRKLSAYASKHKNSINSSRFFIKQKARLRIENKTRWSSSFLMLDSFHKALKKQAFPPEDPCPVSLEVLELYLQILQPAFIFNLIMQKSKSSIADVLPALNIMLSKWNRMQVTGTYRQLCDYLICAFKKKFKDEISSSVYCVASLLNVSKLTWMSRPDCSTMKKNALDSLVNVAKQVTQKKSKQQSNHQNHLNETVVSSGTVDSLAECMRDDDYLSETEVESEITTYEIEKEKIYFIQNVIDKNSFKCNSTAKFWTEKNKEMPILKKLAVILLNIPSSSAYIERFYSICGLVCKTNCGNMTSSTIIQRSTLKANIDILDSLNI